MTNDSVVLINSFEIPAAERDRFMRSWEEAHEVLIAQDGYLSSQLQEDAAGDPQARFLDVANWESEAAFRRAMATPEVVSLLRPYGFTTSLYQVVRADQHWDAQSAARRAAYVAARTNPFPPSTSSTVPSWSVR